VSRREDAFDNALPFRRRVLLGALVAGLALVCVAGGLAWHQYDDARQSALNDARARVLMAGAMIDTYFSGQLTTLSSIAQAPALMAEDASAMHAYLKRVQPPGGGPFIGGVGWIDRTGVYRASSTWSKVIGADVSDRSYVKAVMATGAPFVSEGLAGRGTKRKIIVMAVPTRDARGTVTGVLAGAMPVNGFDVSRGTAELGFAGLSVLDRQGRAVLDGFKQPRNTTLLRELQQRQVGLLTDSRGLDGRDGHVVAYATASIPGWTIVIDRPRSEIFAAAGRGLLLELALIAAAAAVVFCLIGWLLLRARREADRRSARARQRDDLAHRLGGASAAADVSNGLATALATAYPGALSVVALEAEDRLGLQLAAVQGSVLSGLVSPDLVTAHPTTVAYESGTAFAVATEAELLKRYPEIHSACSGAVRSLYCSPLRASGGRPIGALCLLFGDERSLDENEQAHVAWCAEEATQALTRARSYEHEHAVAVSLQRSLLSQDLPAIEGVELLGRYQAGSAGLEVGGDWYDVVRRGDGIVHITVGDVAGRGLSAAVLMGQMRNAFRAYAYDHTSPAELLRRMRRHISGDEMATAVCLAIDPYTQELTYASAGHPPSLLCDGASGTVTRLDGAGAPPLGYAQAEAIQDADFALPAGATLVAYTDGLIERRGWSIDVGIDLLAEVLAVSAAQRTEDLAATIVADVAATVDSGDDIALLIVRFAGAPARMELEIPSDPAALAGLRRRLRAWLTLRGLCEDELNDTVLAVSEACNNAIEHAYREQAGVIRLLLEHRDGALEIAIQDDGGWRDPSPDPERGRGLGIMRAVMHEARIEHAANGTRVMLTLRFATESAPQPNTRRVTATTSTAASAAVPVANPPTAPAGRVPSDRAG
jgi:serine phosphatase RsbU (regulator of sigma subunit)/anti-sigma regulatory factor (Ser/Thr protein kinase)